MQVQRFTPTSSLDPTFTSPAFDYAGQVAQASDGAHAMSIQPNGQLMVAGAHFFGSSVFGVACVNPTGSADP